MSIIRLGDNGIAVEALQSELNKLGASLIVDGAFGPKTLAAVKLFQSNANIAVDGIAGPITQRAIGAALAATPPPVVTPPSGIITNPKFIDISHGDDVTSWEDIVNAGYVMVSHKASQGKSFQDNRIASRWPLMGNVGLMRQAYCFYNFGEGITAQYDNFMRSIPFWLPSDKPHMLDFGEVDLAPSQQLWDEGLGLLESLFKVSGKLPWLYGSEGLLNQYNLPAEFAKYPLWVADPTYTPPRHVSPWNGSFIAHQYILDTGIVPGVGNGCDIDYFWGTLDKLKAL